MGGVSTEALGRRDGSWGGWGAPGGTMPPEADRVIGDAVRGLGEVLRGVPPGVSSAMPTAASSSLEASSTHILKCK